MTKGPESKGAPRKLSLKEKSISGLSWFVRAAIISLALAGCDKDSNNNPDGGTDAGTDPIVDCINNTDCVDTDLCNGEETCNLTSYTCVDGTPIDHDDGDACNGLETCDPSDGSMIPGTPIDYDDGDACNGLETCDPSDGSMIPGEDVDCDDGLACNGVESCDSVTGCDNPPDVDCGTHGSCEEPSGDCDCTDGYTGDNCEVAPAPTIDVDPLPAPCTDTPVDMCEDSTEYVVPFTYSGPVTDITGYCTITDSATPGTITEIIYGSGSGTFKYTSSTNGVGAQETIHLDITGPGGNDIYEHTHYII